MKIEYEYTFGLPRGIVWKMIKDTSILKNSIPGCKSFVESKNGLYQAEIDINFGPIKDVFILDVWLVQEKSQRFIDYISKEKEISGKLRVMAISPL